MGTAAQLINQGISPSPGAVLIGNVNYIPPGLEGSYMEPFCYSVIFASIATGVTQTQSTNVQNDSYFVAVKRLLENWDQATGNTTNTLPQVTPMLARILDTSSGKFSMDQPTPVANIFGTGMNPAVELYRAKLYMPGGQISVELTNGMSTTQRVRITFEGFKIYPKIPDSLVG